jgi:aminoglycoside 6-adenylyltransferase
MFTCKPGRCTTETQRHRGFIVAILLLSLTYMPGNETRRDEETKTQRLTCSHAHMLGLAHMLGYPLGGSHAQSRSHASVLQCFSASVLHRFTAILPRMETTEQLIAWGSSIADIRAMLITSTRAIAGAPLDRYSDYDIILVVEEIPPYVADRTWLDAFGEVLIGFWDPIYPEPDTGLPHCGNVIYFRSGVRIDFTLWSVAILQQISALAELPAELDAGYRVLLDKDGLANVLHPPSGKAYIPEKPTAEQYQLLINDFFVDALAVAKYLWRDDLLPAKWCLDDSMRFAYLVPLLQWRIQCDHHWALPLGNLGKRLKHYLPPQRWQQFEQTFAGASIADNWRALDAMIALLREVAVEVGDALGYAYPHELEQQVLEYVAEMRPSESLNH